jgi:hypothetical protein
MLSKRELSDRVDILFNLQPGEFDPEQHLPLAEELVGELGLKRAPLYRGEGLQFRYEEKKFELETEGSGLYVLRHQGKLYGSAYLGLNLKLDFTHWREEVLGGLDETHNTLSIGYKGKEVKKIIRFEMIPLNFNLGILNFSYFRAKSLWSHKT